MPQLNSIAFLILQISKYCILNRYFLSLGGLPLIGCNPIRRAVKISRFHHPPQLIKKDRPRTALIEKFRRCRFPLHSPPLSVRMMAVRRYTCIPEADRRFLIIRDQLPILRARRFYSFSLQASLKAFQRANLCFQDHFSPAGNLFKKQASLQNKRKNRDSVLFVVIQHLLLYSLLRHDDMFLHSCPR